MLLLDLVVTSRPIYISSGDCGYCKGQKENPYALESWSAELSSTDKPLSITIGFSIEQMLCSTYDHLMNIGFRRSGTFLYKPDLLRGCCRLFTIRTNMDGLKLGKQHRQTINRFISAIEGPPQESKKNAKVVPGSIPPALEKLFAQERTTDKSIFYTEFGPSVFTKEKYLLYKKYQVRVHNDKEEDVSEQSFKRFLCDTPFSEEEVLADDDTWEYLNLWNKTGEVIASQKKRIGPTHECYYLRGKLIAISVLDFLPSGVSSIYFIWDPDYPQLSLGTLSGLREIYMCKKLNLGYYYLGYYVDDCVKMKYKKRFGGEVLDIANMSFVPFNKLDLILEGGKFFTIDPAHSNPSEVSEKEQQIDLDKFPSDFSTSHFTSPISNVAENIYQPKLPIYAKADDAMSNFCAKYQVCLNDDVEKYYKLPNVVPGLIPTLQLLAQFEADNIKERAFFVLRNKITLMPFAQMTGEEKRIIVDCIRLLGLEVTLKTLVFY